MWTDILTAVALVLVIEGLIPFSGPSRYRQIVAQMAELSDNALRGIGLASMLAGLLLLYFIRG